MFFITVVTAMFGIAAAIPQAVPSAAFCANQVQVLRDARELRQAEAYCSWWDPARTATVTVTLTDYTTTSTVHEYSTISTSTVFAMKNLIVPTTVVSGVSVVSTSTVIVTSTTGVLGTSLVTSCALPTTTTPAKRSVPRPLPFVWEGRHDRWIRKACRCLQAAPTTTTVTTTTCEAATTTCTDDVVATWTSTVNATSLVPTTILSSSTSVTVVTSTSMVTTTSGTTAIAAIPTFIVYANGGDNDGRYFGTAENENRVRITDNALLSQADYFSIQPDGTLEIAAVTNPSQISNIGDIANEDSDDISYDPYSVFAQNSTTIMSNGPAQEAVTCTIGVNADGSCPLDCITPSGYTLNFDCGIWWRLAPPAGFNLHAVPDEDCYQFNPYVIAASP